MATTTATTATAPKRELYNVVRQLSSSFRLSFLKTVQKQTVYRQAAQTQADDTDLLSNASQLFDDFIATHCKPSLLHFVNYDAMENGNSAAQVGFRDELRSYVESMLSAHQLRAELHHDINVVSLLRASYACEYLQTLAEIVLTISPTAKVYAPVLTTIYSWIQSALTNLKQSDLDLSPELHIFHVFFTSNAMRMFHAVCNIARQTHVSFAVLKNIVPQLPTDERTEESELCPYRRTVAFLNQTSQEVNNLFEADLRQLETFVTKTTQTPSDLRVLAEEVRSKRILYSTVRLWLYLRMSRLIRCDPADKRFVLRYMTNHHVHARWLSVYLHSVFENEEARITFAQFLRLRPFVSKTMFIAFTTIVSVCNGAHCDKENSTSVSRIISNIVEQLAVYRSELWEAVLDGQPVANLEVYERNQTLLAARLMTLRKTFARFWKSVLFLAATIRHTTTVLSTGRTLEMCCEFLNTLVLDIRRFPVLDMHLFQESSHTMSYLELVDTLFRAICEAVHNNQQSCFQSDEVCLLLRVGDAMNELHAALPIESSALVDSRISMGWCLRAVARMLRVPRQEHFTLIPSVKNSFILDTLFFKFAHCDDVYWELLQHWRPTALNALHYYTNRFLRPYVQAFDVQARDEQQQQQPETAHRFTLDKFPEENAFYVAQLCAVRNSTSTSSCRSLHDWRDANEFVRMPLPVLTETNRINAVGRLSPGSQTDVLNTKANVQVMLDEVRQIGEPFLQTFLMVCPTNSASLVLFERILSRKKSITLKLAKESFHYLLKMSVHCSEADRKHCQSVFRSLLSKFDVATFFDRIDETPSAPAAASSSQPSINANDSGTREPQQQQQHVASHCVRVAKQSRCDADVLLLVRKWLSSVCRTSSSASLSTKKASSATSWHSDYVPYSILAEFVRTHDLDHPISVVEQLAASRADMLQALIRMCLRHCNVSFLELIVNHCDNCVVKRTVPFEALNEVLQSQLYTLWNPNNNNGSAASSSAGSSDWHLQSPCAEDYLESQCSMASLIRFWLVAYELDSVAQPQPHANVVMPPARKKRLLQATFSRNLFGRNDAKSASTAGASSSSSSSAPPSLQPGAECDWSKLFFYSLFLGDTSLLTLTYSHIEHDFCPLVDKTCELELVKFSTVASQCLESCKDSIVGRCAGRALRSSVLWLLERPLFLVAESNALWNLMEQLLVLEVIERDVIVEAIVSSCKKKLFVPVRLLLELDNPELFDSVVFRMLEDKSAVGLLPLYNRAKANIRSYLERHVQYPPGIEHSARADELKRAYWMTGCREEALFDPITMIRFEEVHNFSADDIYTIDNGRNWMFLDTLVDLIRSSPREHHYNGDDTLVQIRRKVVDPFSRARVDHSVVENIVQLAEQRAARHGRPFDNPFQSGSQTPLTVGRYSVVQSTTRVVGHLYFHVGLQHDTSGAVLWLVVIPLWLEDNMQTYALNPNEMPSVVLVRVVELIRGGQFFTTEAISSLETHRTLHTFDGANTEPVMPLERIVSVPHALFADEIRRMQPYTEEAIYQQYLRFVRELERV